MTFFSKKKYLFNPYFIAEIGVNHECSIFKAKKLILKAAKSGANAVKFQFYKAHKIASKFSPAYWDTNKEKSKNQYDLFKKYDSFEIKQYEILSNYCKKLKVDFLCTPFDVSAVKSLKKLVKIFKISSSDITNFELLDAVAKTKKTIILSTGASNIKEIKNSIKFLKQRGANEIALLHCILNYPTLDENANLSMILDLKKKFKNFTIGYSDHTLPNKNMDNLFIATILGSEIIEKHFTDNKKKGGNDHYHSLDNHDLKNFKSRIKKLKKIMGSEKKTFLKSEVKSRLFARRSVYSKSNISKGDIFNKKNIICKRPSNKGLSSINFFKIIGKKANKNIAEDVPITFNMIK